MFNLRGTSSGWVGETAARPATDTGTFGQLVYRVGEIYANPAATQQLLDDALVDLESWLAGEVQTEFAYQENLAFVSGSGANNRPNGLLTYITGGANAAAHPFGAVTATNTGAAAALTGDGIVNLAMALPSAFTANARFIMNRNTMAAVRLLKDGQGNYLWQASYQAGTPQTLAGYAMVEVPAMPDVAAGAKPIVFGDFDQGYLIVDGIGTRILRDPYTNKPFVQFYTTKRVGGGLLNPEALKAQNVAA
ncbi:MAG: phage major capsid protein [Roseovarius sp.]|nr:phage major capsid protein [Roseovarius sp.]